MRRFIPQTLVWRFGLSIMGALIIVSLVLWLYAAHRLRTFHFEQTQACLTDITTLLASRYESELIDPDSNVLADLIHEDSIRIGARITIIRQDGAVLADSQATPESMDNHRHRPEIREAVEQGRGAAVRFSRTIGADLLYVAQRMEVGSEFWIVRIARSMQSVEIGLTTMNRLLGIAGSLSIVLTLLITYVVSRRLSHRVEELAIAASRFADGEFDHHIPQPNVQELAHLADGLNHMASQLDTRILELQQNHRVQEAIITSMDHGLIVLDENQRILQLNQAAFTLLEIEASSVIGRFIPEVVRHPDILRSIEWAKTGADLKVYEINLGEKTGRRLMVSVKPFEITEQQGSNMLILLTDVTHLRRLESMRSDFAANVSHELHTPITNIGGYAETLLDVGWKDDAQTRRFIGIIHENCQRLASIVEDVLSLSDLERPGMSAGLERVPTPVQELAGIVLERVRSDADAKGMSLQQTIPENLMVSVHPRLMEQALYNLMSNAVRYGPPDSTITVSAFESDDKWITLAVADEGPGIAAEHLDRIFERFYRVDRNRSRATGGTGLGLSIVKHIALVHGGQVLVESKPGKGSAFSLRLPVLSGE